MLLQEAIDIIHEIREEFPHVVPHLVEQWDYSKSEPRYNRNDEPLYIIGCYSGDVFGGYYNHCVISAAYEWYYMQKFFNTFTPNRIHRIHDGTGRFSFKRFVNTFVDERQAIDKE